MKTLSHLAIILVEGKQAETFLQGQLTCNIQEVSPKQSRLAAYCTPKGRVITTCRVFKFQDNYYLLLPASQSEIILERLGKFAVFSKVSLKDVSSDWVILGYCGSPEEMVVPHEADQVEAYEEFAVIREYGDTPRYYIVAKPNLLSNNMRSSLNINEQNLADEDTWRLLDIRAGIAYIYPKTSELFTPNMLRLTELKGLSFNKGCYVGQEIIARTHYLGKVKRTLQTFILQSHQAPKPGDSIYNAQSQSVGTVVDAILTTSQGCELLAIIQDATNETFFFNGLELKPHLN